MAERPGGTLISLAPAAGELGHLLRVAIDAEQVGATRIHLPLDQPDFVATVAGLRRQTDLVITTDPDHPEADLVDRLPPDFTEIVLDELRRTCARRRGRPHRRRRPAEISVGGRGSAACRSCSRRSPWVRICWSGPPLTPAEPPGHRPARRRAPAEPGRRRPGRPGQRVGPDRRTLRRRRAGRPGPVGGSADPLLTRPARPPRLSRPARPARPDPPGADDLPEEHRLSTAPVELVHVHRSGLHEGTHFGSVVITAADGSVLHQRGDVTTPMFPRSSNKPFQAVGDAGQRRRPGRRRPGAGGASHSGEPMHVERALAMLERAGLTEDDLRLPAGLPAERGGQAGGARGRRRPAPDLHELLRQARRHAGRLRRQRLGHRPTTSTRTIRCSAVADAVARLSGEHRPRSASTAAARRCSRSRWSALARAFGAGRTPRPTARPSDGGRRHAGVPGDGRRHRPGRHPADACLPGPAGQGRRGGGALRGTAGRPLRRGEDHRRRRPGPDAGAGRRAAPDGPDARDPEAARLLDEFAVGTVLGGGEPVGTVTVAPGVF